MASQSVSQGLGECPMQVDVRRGSILFSTITVNDPNPLIKDDFGTE